MRKYNFTMHQIDTRNNIPKSQCLGRCLVFCFIRIVANLSVFFRCCFRITRRFVLRRKNELRIWLSTTPKRWHRCGFQVWEPMQGCQVFLSWTNQTLFWKEPKLKISSQITNVEVWGVGQRRGCLWGMLSLHVELLISPNATNSKAAWWLYEYCSKSRLKLPNILSCEAEARRLALATLQFVFAYFLVHNSLFTKSFWLALIASLVSLTRLDSSHNFLWLGLDSSHVEKNGNSTRSESESFFCKISAPRMDKPRSFAHKEISIFCFCDDQNWCKISVLTV